MASVYRARQASLDRFVALKILLPRIVADPEVVVRFEREARAIAKLHHPNVIEVYDFDQADGHSFIVMQYVEGGTLRDRLARRSQRGERISAGELLTIVTEIAAGLSYAHREGIIHRDVKPSNILFDRDGRAVLADFGIARVASEAQLTRTSIGIGTPEYMSPEQCEGKPVDARADVYSLGIVVYEMLTGRLPFTGDTPVAVAMAQVHAPLPAASSIEPLILPATDAVLDRVLAKEPDRRYATAVEFADALRASLAAPTADLTAVTGVMAGASLQRRMTWRPTWMRAHPRWSLAVGAGLLALGALAAATGGQDVGVVPTEFPPQPSQTSALAAIPTAAGATASDSAAAARCALPIYTDTYLGFTIGRPASWRISYIDGVVHLAPDASGREEALVYPVRLAAGTTADRFVGEYAAALNAALAPTGGSLKLSGSQLTGNIGGAAISGELRTRTLGPDLVVYGGWGPSERWISARPTILAIGECYTRIQPKLMQRQSRTSSDANVGSTTFTFSLPDGWQLSSLTPRGLDLSPDGVTLVSFAYITGFLSAVTPESLADQLFAGAGYVSLRVLKTEALGTVTDPLGYRWTAKGFEFEAMFKGQAVHGVLTAATGVFSAGGLATSNGLASLRQAPTDQWELLAAITAAVQESILIADAKPGQGVILPRNNPLDSSSILSSYAYKSAVDSRLSQQRQETIMGFANARSPTTGATYQVPYNAYNPAGAQGAGYYRALPGGGTELLQPINR